MTMLVVAHRLSTVRYCDQVRFLEAGRVGRGRHLRRGTTGQRTFDHLVELGTLDGSLDPDDRRSDAAAQPRS